MTVLKRKDSAETDGLRDTPLNPISSLPISNKILYQRYWLVCEGNPSLESCVEGKS